MYVYIYIYTYSRSCVMYIIYIYIYVYTHIYIYIYTQTPNRFREKHVTFQWQSRILSGPWMVAFLEGDGLPQALCHESPRPSLKEKKGNAEDINQRQRKAGARVGLGDGSGQSWANVSTIRPGPCKGLIHKTQVVELV